MKRLCLIVPLLFCLLLSGCGRNTVERACLDFAEQLRSREELAFRAKVVCEYEDQTASFVLDYVLREGQQTVTVVEPRSIAGVQVRLKPGSRELVYRDLILDLGEGDQGVHPARALPLLVEALREGHLDSCWREEGAPAAQFVLDDRLSVQVRFTPEGMIPLEAELLRDGQTAARCHISDWR